MPTAPSLPEIIEAGNDRRLRGTHTACVGTFVSYSAATYEATVQPQDLDGVTPDPIEDVPVCIPGAWAAGDPCLIVFSEEEFGPELASTGNKRRHGLYAVAVPLIARQGDTTDFVALAQLVLDRLNTIKSTFDAHTHPDGMGGTGPPLTPMATPASVAAGKVRAR